jgi:hypothetical protein
VLIYLDHDISQTVRRNLLPPSVDLTLATSLYIRHSQHLNHFRHCVLLLLGLPMRRLTRYTGLRRAHAEEQLLEKEFDVGHELHARDTKCTGGLDKWHPSAVFYIEGDDHDEGQMWGFDIA